MSANRTVDTLYPCGCSVGVDPDTGAFAEPCRKHGATGHLRIRVIDQEWERMWVELTIPNLLTPPDHPIDLEVLYPDGTTVRYARAID